MPVVSSAKQSLARRYRFGDVSDAEVGMYYSWDER